jgi:hypothetical protein
VRTDDLGASEDATEHMSVKLMVQSLDACMQNFLHPPLLLPWQCSVCTC